MGRIHLCFKTPIYHVGWLEMNPSCVQNAVKPLVVRQQGRGMQPQCWRCWIGATLPCVAVVLRQPGASGEEGPWGKWWPSCHEGICAR